MGDALVSTSTVRAGVYCTVYSCHLAFAVVGTDCISFIGALVRLRSRAGAGEYRFFQVFCLHIGQVMFQGGTVLSGLFFLVGIWINSRLNGLYAMWGAVLPLGAALFPDMGILGAEAGLLGYNGVLCAIALGTASLKGFGEATAAVLLSTVLQIAGMRIGITTLTAPFVLATWTVVLLRKVW